jgi:hypothetical protein
MYQFSLPRCASPRRLLTLAVVATLSGCGWIADTDRYVIAELDGEPITRAMLFKHIRDLPDPERPRIQSRQDYLQVLNDYINDEIKIPLGQELADEGKISVSRDEAREAYFQSIKDETERDMQRRLWELEIPKPGEETELMRVYGLDAASLQFQKNVIDIGTDKQEEIMLADQAVAYLAIEAFQNKELQLDEEVLRLEYEMTKSEFQTFENIVIRGLQFPTSLPGAAAEAAKVRRRVDAGENFDRIIDEYMRRNPQLAIESVLENNPDVDRFRGFWQEASGASVGDIRGPVYMPSYARLREVNGQVEQAVVPECYLVFQVIEHTPEESKTFEEAVPLIAPKVAQIVMMEKLRDQHGVVIYRDKLPSPSGGQSTMLTN